MRKILNQVEQFHIAADQMVGDTRKPDVTVDVNLRLLLIEEEFNELKLALQGKAKDGTLLTKNQQVVAVADALADLSYVTVGSAITWGIPLDAVVDEVHRSNMSKFTISGDGQITAIRNTDGKILKGPNYVPPDIHGVIKIFETSSSDEP